MLAVNNLYYFSLGIIPVTTKVLPIPLNLTTPIDQTTPTKGDYNTSDYETASQSSSMSLEPDSDIL